MTGILASCRDDATSCVYVCSTIDCDPVRVYGSVNSALCANAAFAHLWRYRWRCSHCSPTSPRGRTTLLRGMQVWPKKSGHMRDKAVESMEEFASRISAARAAIGEADFFLIARTDARGTSAKHGLAEAITRANLYVDAGANCSLVEGPRSTYELQTIAENSQGYLAVSISEGGLTPLHSYQQLKEMGFQMVRTCSCVLTGVLRSHMHGHIDRIARLEATARKQPKQRCACARDVSSSVQVLSRCTTHGRCSGLHMIVQAMILSSLSVRCLAHVCALYWRLL